MLVIIGLLIGGILVAQSMISTAKIQSQIRQYQQFDILKRNFITKYNQLPGDCTFCDHSSYGSPGAVGNGNGVLEDVTHTFPLSYTDGESEFFFPDLSQMAMESATYVGMIGGQYKVGTGYVYPSMVIGVNDSGLGAIGNNRGDVFYAMFESTTAGYLTTMMAHGHISAIEALGIDQKIDDGNPSSGDVVAIKNTITSDPNDVYPMLLEDGNGTCILTGSPNLYNVSNSAPALCSLLVKSE